MNFGDNILKRVTRFIYKWTLCYFIHRKYKCWPRDPKNWHCMKCHPCGEVFDFLLEGKRCGWF